MSEHQIEGGATAYCAECDEFGHYQTVHHMSVPFGQIHYKR